MNGETMKASLRHVKNMQFLGITNGGHTVNFDAFQAVGGEETAGTPMEVLLLCLASCTAMDVVAILSKKKQRFDSFDILVAADKTEKHPKVFSKITLKYVFSGGTLEEKAVARAIELSMERFCSVSAMLKKGGVVVEHGHEIVEKP